MVCTRCGAVQALPPAADLFWVLGLPRRLALDAADLERRYHALSRAVHPDRFQTGSAEDRARSLEASAAVNRAYRTLRDPIARGRYWLELHGIALSDGGPRVPPGLAAEVFETQEKLEALRAGGGTAVRAEVEGVRADLAARLAALRDALVDGWARGDVTDAAALEALRQRLAEIAYLRTLMGDIEDSLDEGLRGTNHRH